MVWAYADATDKVVFREAMAAFPSGVTIVTTVDDAGRWWGFTATSFCSVSMEPPLTLVCLARSAECHDTFAVAQRWVVHIIHPRQISLATRFATRGADKFADAGFVAHDHGLPVLPGACVTLHCSAHNKFKGGDHTILVGRVERAWIGDEIPAVYFRRRYHVPSRYIDVRT